MTVNRFFSSTARGAMIAIFGLILVAGCETAPTPVELARPSAKPASPHVTSVVSVARETAEQAGSGGLAAELNQASQRIQSAPKEPPERTRRASVLEESIIQATSPSAAESHPGPTTIEATDEDVTVIEFGTDIYMPFGGPITVTAYTIASRATRITHVIRVTKTVGGRSYTSTFNDNSGFFNQRSLYTTVGISGDCGTFIKVDAKTDHTAGSPSVQNAYGMSTDTETCGDPTETCGGEDEGGPDDVAVQGADDEASVASDCTGGGPAPGGETTRYTCYTTVTDYYWYYPDTNTYEYRYSEETTWCEEAAA